MNIITRYKFRQLVKTLAKPASIKRSLSMVDTKGLCNKSDKDFNKFLLEEIQNNKRYECFEEFNHGVCYRDNETNSRIEVLHLTPQNFRDVVRNIESSYLTLDLRDSLVLLIDFKTGLHSKLLDYVHRTIMRIQRCMGSEIKHPVVVPEFILNLVKRDLWDGDSFAPLYVATSRSDLTYLFDGDRSATRFSYKLFDKNDPLPIWFISVRQSLLSLEVESAPLTHDITVVMSDESMSGVLKCYITKDVFTDRRRAMMFKNILGG